MVNEEEIAQEAVRIILFLNSTKKPVKLSDVLNNLSTKPSRSEQTALLNSIKMRLKNLGISLVHVDKSAFVLVSAEKPIPWVNERLPTEIRAERTLLLLILAYLLMRENYALEEDVMRHLTSLGIISEDKPVHKYFGDVQKLVKHRFVEQMYLERVRDKDNNAEFRWGSRAYAEVTIKDVLDWVCTVGFNGCRKSEDFPAQLKLAAEQVTPN